MTEQKTCRSCGKPRGHSAKKASGLCHSCAGHLQGKAYGKGQSMVFGQPTAKPAKAGPTESWWTKPTANYAEAAKRMAGNGWNLE